MKTAVLGGEPRQGRSRRVQVGEEYDRSAGQSCGGGHAPILADFTRSIALAETVRRVEEGLAGTLRAMAAQATGPVSARRLRLAEDAARGAQAAAEYGERLRQQALRWAGHAGMVAPREWAFHRRLADIDRRLAELQLVRPKRLGDDPAAPVMQDAHGCAQEAQRHCQDAVTHLAQARQLAAEALDLSASAHDRAAEANARSAGAGIGDVAEHNRMAAFHRAAAQADRQRAREARIISGQSLEAMRESQQA
jgi:hypothetical protein